MACLSAVLGTVTFGVDLGLLGGVQHWHLELRRYFFPFSFSINSLLLVSIINFASCQAASFPFCRLSGNWSLTVFLLNQMTAVFWPVVVIAW